MPPKQATAGTDSTQIHLVNKTGAVVQDGPARAVLRTIGAALSVRDDQSRDRLLTAVRRAIDTNTPSVLMLGSSEVERHVVMVRPSGRDSLAVVASAPMDQGLLLLNADQLHQLFDLSRSEAEIAIGILRGSSLVEIAEQRRVQHETVRGQVKSLLHKVGVANQKQLVARLVVLAAALSNVMSLAFATTDNS
jgi:DNA-binding CsgD family transcriptional regulator